MGEYIPVAPINDQARKHNGNLPGMGGIFNLVNMHVYHYAGNNPIKLIDPDGRSGEDVEITPPFANGEKQITITGNFPNSGAAYIITLAEGSIVREGKIILDKINIISDVKIDGISLDHLQSTVYSYSRDGETVSSPPNAILNHDLPPTRPQRNSAMTNGINLPRGLKPIDLIEVTVTLTIRDSGETVTYTFNLLPPPMPTPTPAPFNNEKRRRRTRD